MLKPLISFLGILVLGFLDDSLLLDTSLLAGEATKIIQLGATYLTNLVHFDAVDVG